MGFWDSFGSSGSDFWSGFGSGGVLDSGGGGSSWTDYLGGDWGDGSGSFLGDLGGDSGSSGSSFGSIVKGLFGGGGSSGSGSGSNIFGSLLAGLGGAASAALSAKDAKELLKLKGQQDLAAIAAQGLEGRKALDFEAQLKDYYTQQDKSRKRAALDTYGQFSLMSKIKPNYQNASPGVSVPAKPVAGP